MLFTKFPSLEKNHWFHELSVCSWKIFDFTNFWFTKQKRKKNWKIWLHEFFGLMSKKEKKMRNLISRIFWFIEPILSKKGKNEKFDFTNFLVYWAKKKRMRNLISRIFWYIEQKRKKMRNLISRIFWFIKQKRKKWRIWFHEIFINENTLVNNVEISEFYCQ